MVIPKKTRGLNATMTMNSFQKIFAIVAACNLLKHRAGASCVPYIPTALSWRNFLFVASRPRLSENRLRAENTFRGNVSVLRVTHGLINRAVMAGDCLTIVFSAWCGDRSWPGFFPFPLLSSTQALLTGVVAAAVLLSSLKALDGYRVERCARPTSFLPGLLLAFAAAATACGLLVAAFLPGILSAGSRRWVMGWGGGIFLALLAERLVAAMAIGWITRCALLCRHVAVVGATKDGETLVRRLIDPSLAGQYQVIGVFDDRSENRRLSDLAGFPIMGRVSDLVAYAQKDRVDVVAIALPWENALAIFRLIEEVQWIAADVVVPFDPHGFQPGAGHMIDLAGNPALQVMNCPLKGTLGLVKLLEDYLVAGVGMILAAPVMAMAALAILMEDGGPILFRQERMGFNGRQFSIYKFRTMQVNQVDHGVVGTSRDNPRITWVGRFLRCFSVDELPQLFNVLRGEMSIVGPRPHVPGMLVGEATYTESVRRYAARHRIKPGITGWAQINGMRGGIHTRDKAERGVVLDLYYIRHWSFWLDVKIMLRTLLVGMKGHDVF
jgi:Undecaprenyl-phosphate glucose phosphotransferase